MKKTTIIAAVLLTALSSANVAIANPNKGDTLAGTVNFNGTIQAVACKIDNQTVSFGNSGRNLFTNSNGKSNVKKEFAVSINDCAASDIQKIEIAGNGTDSYLNTTGTAKNVGISIVYADEATPINFTKGKEISGEGVKVGAHKFNAELVRAGGLDKTVTAGDFTGTMTFTVTYN